MAPFIVLAAWLVLNVVATRELIRLGDRLRMPRMRIAMVWIVPFMGAGMSFLETTAARRQLREEGGAALAKAHEPAPDAVFAGGAVPFPLRQHLGVVNGFAMLDWSAAATWLRSIPDEPSRAAARLDLHRAWLEHLRDSIDATFWIHENEDAMILSSLDPASVGAMGRYVSMARKRVVRTLGALARFPAGLKTVVLVVDDEDAYYHYIAMFGPDEGEFALSGGSFINMGCPHFVVRRADLGAVEPVIAHELTHSALAHLNLPLWIDEGLAVNTEHRIAGAHRGLHTPRELHARHIAFWDDERIQQFWSGESFRRADDGNMLSYDLARIMVAQLGRSWPAFERFAAAARRADAGDAAAREHLELDLGAYVSLMFEREPGAGWMPAAIEPAPAQAALPADESPA